VLLVIDSPDLGRAKADYLSALAMEKVAVDTAERERLLFEKKITSERDWRQAEAEAVKTRAERDAAENRLHALGIGDDELGRIKAESHYTSTMPILSPLDGVVVERAVSLGQMVEPSDTLAIVMDLREVWVQVDIYDRDLSQVKVGQDVTARIAAYPDREFKGKVQTIGSVVEEKTRSVKVRVALGNAERLLKPGMFASVTLQGTTGEVRDRLVVPSAAVQREGGGHVVFVRKSDHDFETRKVELLRELGEWAEIASGVTEGEAVVTTGSFFLKSEMQKAELGGGHSH
jgi:cobalt-zinc-cadmium efflux system membrane fusion protein